jgi:hypothetical protein
MTTQTATKWTLTGKGYEFCNCNPGCTCNFGGFPSSADGACKALIANRIDHGRFGDVDLSGITAIAIADWPKAIHEGNGRVVFVVPPATTDAQVNALAQIYTGQAGGMPWEMLGTTFTVAGLVKADIRIDDKGMHSGITIPGVGEATGTTLKNPVTGEDNRVKIVLDTPLMWKEGDCGLGSFHVESSGIALDFKDTNWILYDFNWHN